MKQLGQEKVSLDLTKEITLPEDYPTFKQVAAQLLIQDETSFSIAAEMIQKQARWESKVDAEFDEGRDLAYKSWKWITGKIAKYKSGYEVRPLLEPKMVKYRKQVEEDRLAREREQARIAEENRLKAEAEARRIQQEADAEALRLRQAGEMRQARELEAAAQQQAASVVEQSLEDLGTIEPAAPKLAGVSDSRPWVGEVVDIKALCKAIGDGTIPLTWSTPVRGSTIEMLPLVIVNQSALNHIAKRMGKEDLGIPGARGIREVQLRFSKSAPAKTQEDEW